MMEAGLLEILQHALGVDRYGRGEMYRRHFVTGPETMDWAKCRALVGAGYMTERPRSELTGNDTLFLVTETGIAAVRRESPAAPTLTRAQRTYEDWLRADCGYSFGEWLRLPRARREGGEW